MAQQQVYKVQAKKMFKVSIGGALPVMINPGDVVEVDRYMAGMLVQSEKAELTQEKVRLNPEYQAPERVANYDALGLILQALQNLTKLLQESLGRPKAPGH